MTLHRALPYSLRILAENLTRRGAHDQLETLLARSGGEIDIAPARVFLHDTNGVPLLVDIAAMRDAVVAAGGRPEQIDAAVPTELVVDHSIVADVVASPDARERNVRIEYQRNAERYRFLRWGAQALANLSVVPPGSGIMHQVNLERLARVVMSDADGTAYPDLCLGTDSHTTMINGLGVLGWGIGGIEAQATMLGLSVALPVPRVVGVRLDGALRPGATTTDLVLTVTELLRAHGVVGAFVEFFGPTVAGLPVPDRATIANMCPEYGATCAYFPIDAETLRYLRLTGRDEGHVRLVETYARRHGIWHVPEHTLAYDEIVHLDLATVSPSLAGPRRPQDRVPMPDLKASFRREVPRPTEHAGLRDGTVAIAAITSCTNTANPSVMVAAGLLARAAVEHGLTVPAWVKTSLSPGSRAVPAYLEKAGLMPYLEKLGFHVAGFGCMTCIGASGAVFAPVARAVDAGLAAAAVLSGNRNFEGRINPAVQLSYLASPPLVVAFALAGTVDIDLVHEPLGLDRDGTPVYLHDLWPSTRDIDAVVSAAIKTDMFTDAYSAVFDGDESWRALDAPSGATFAWDEQSTYLRRSTFLDTAPRTQHDLRGARALLVLGDSITTDHISPAGAIPAESVAGRYLADHGVELPDLNTYASRRGNHEVMVRAAFANTRLRNLLTPDLVGGHTRDFTRDGAVTTVHDASLSYRAAGVPLLVLAGREYGTGSSRDWAAKGPALLGVRAVLAESYERIHRSNLIGLGILPLQYRPGEGRESLGLRGDEIFDVVGLDGAGAMPATAQVHAGDRHFEVIVRLDTKREVEYYRAGGILPYVLSQAVDR